jgi:hypothetical protein
MRKAISIAAIALLALMMALAAATVQFYRHGRNATIARSEQVLVRSDIDDSFRNACNSLQNLQIYGTNYVLTGRADSLKAYRGSLEDWQYETGTLQLMSGDDARSAFAADLLQTGNQLADEMAAIVAIYEGGSHDAALDRLRKGAAMACRDKIGEIEEARQKAFGRVAGKRLVFIESIATQHRLVFCAGGLSALGFLGLALLFCFFRTTAGSDAGTRSKGVTAVASR